MTDAGGRPHPDDRPNAAGEANGSGSTTEAQPAVGATDARALLRNARSLVKSGGGDNPHRRGVAQVARGDLRGAMSSFREAIAAAPDAPWSYVALADVLVEVGADEEAVQAYRDALARTPPSAVALLESIGRGLGEVGHAAETTAIFRAVLAQEPGRPVAAVGLARALLAEAEGLRAEAARVLADVEDLGADSHLVEVAVDAAPRDAGLYGRLARSLARRGDRARAIAVVQVGLAHDPGEPTALAVLAELLADDPGTGDGLPDELRQRLLDLVEHGVRTQPGDVQLLERRARLVSRYGEPREAVDAWRAVVDVAPDVAESHRQLGDRLAAIGDFEAAGVAYDRAVALGYQVW